MRSSQVIRNTSSLLAPTMSSKQRSTLTSVVGHIDPPATLPFPLPQTPRTATDIASLRRSLHLPIERPPGPIVRRAVPNEEEGEDEEEEDTKRGDQESNAAGHSLLYLPRGSSELRDEDPYSNSSRGQSGQEAYHTSRIPQVELPSQIHQQRPYSSYRTISRQLAEKRDAERNGPYQGAYTHEFWNPDEQQRKEHLQSREKFLAGEFKTVIGAANTFLPVRKEGYVRGEGQYPLEPPGSMTARPDKTTAIHFASMPRTTQPLLAGAWK